MLLTLLSPRSGVVPALVAGGIGGKRKRYFIERAGRLLMFATAAAAQSALAGPVAEPDVSAAETEKPSALRVAAEVATEIAPEQQIDLAALQAQAALVGQLAAYQAAYRSRHFAALLALFEQLQDDDDVELLLLSL
jgi:hypothetical protein